MNIAFLVMTYCSRQLGLIIAQKMLLKMIDMLYKFPLAMCK